MGLDVVLKKHNILLSDINPDQEHFKRQEQMLPDICADRIEYNLHTALIYKQITANEAHKILNDLQFDNEKNQWYFISVKYAKKFSKLPLIFTKHFWGAKENLYIYQLTSKMLKRALKINLINNNQLHYAMDPEIITILDASDDAEITFYLNHIKKVSMKELIRQNFNHDLKGNKTKTIVIRSKFRGVNPYVMVKGKLNRLTTLDKEFKQEYEDVKSTMSKGHKITIPLFRGQ